MVDTVSNLAHGRPLQLIDVKERDQVARGGLPRSAESLYFLPLGLRVALLHLIDLCFIESCFVAFALPVNSVPIELELD